MEREWATNIYVSVMNRSAEWVLEIKDCWIVGEGALVDFLKNIQRWVVPERFERADLS